MKKIMVYGQSETNDRLGFVVNYLNSMKVKIYRGGEANSFGNKISEFINLVRSNAVYIAPFYHAKTKLIKLAKILHKEVIVDFYASIYDMDVIDRKRYSPNSKEAEKAMRVDCIAVAEADKIMFLNEAEAQYYLSLQNGGQFMSKAKIVPLVLEDRAKARLDYYTMHQGVYNIVFCGTYIPLHGIQIIVDAMAILKSKNRNVRLCMWGGEFSKNVSKPWQEQIKSRKMEDVVYFRNDWKKETYYGWCAQNCALMLGVFGQSKKAYTVVPNKVVDAVAFGIPCITGISKGNSEFFDGVNDVVLIEHSAQALADAIEMMMNQTQVQIRKRVERTDLVFEKNFSQRAFDKSVSKVFDL